MKPSATAVIAATPLRRRVLDHLQRAEQAMTALQISKDLGAQHGAVFLELLKLEAAGLVCSSRLRDGGCAWWEILITDRGKAAVRGQAADRGTALAGRRHHSVDPGAGRGGPAR